MRHLRIGMPLILFAPPFDAAAFMNATIDEPLATEYILPPIAEYRAMIDDFDEKAFETFEGDSKQKPGEKWTMTKFNCPVILLDDALAAKLGREKVVVRCQMILDFTDDGQLDFGPNKNVKLGQLREALGQNIKGQPWAPSLLKGAGPLMAKIGHKNIAPKGEDPRYIAEVTRFGRIS